MDYTSTFYICQTNKRCFPLIIPATHTKNRNTVRIKKRHVPDAIPVMNKRIANVTTLNKAAAIWSHLHVFFENLCIECVHSIILRIILRMSNRIIRQTLISTLFFPWSIDARASSSVSYLME